MSIWSLKSALRAEGILNGTPPLSPLRAIAFGVAVDGTGAVYVNLAKVLATTWRVPGLYRIAP